MKPQHRSLTFIVPQIIWYSLGLSILYDTMETFWGCPHALVVTVYSSLLVVSAWFNQRAVRTLCTLALLIIFLSGLHAWTAALPLKGALTTWFGILWQKRFDYICWCFVIAGGMLGVAKGKISFKAAVACFLIGCSLTFYQSIHSLLAAGTKLEAIMTVQGTNLIWLAYMGMPSKQLTQRPYAGACRLSSIILIAGTSSYVLSDWVYQHLTTSLQVLWMLIAVAYPIFLVKRYRRTYT